MARRIGATPQNLSARIKRVSITVEEIEQIAEAAGDRFERAFILKNGETI